MGDSVSSSTPSGFKSVWAERVANAWGILLLVGAAACGVWMATTSSAGVFGSIFLFIVGTLVGLVPGAFLFLGACRLLQTPEQNALEKASARAAKDASQQRGVPIREWRGILCMTQSAVVAANCTRCNKAWNMEGQVANTIAEAQGLGNRLIRGGTKTEQLGATFTAGASGRRIAAGLESERQQRELAMVLGMGVCPSCGRLDGVHLRKL